MTVINPYKSRPLQAFWRKGVADVHYADLADLWQPMHLTRSDKVAIADGNRTPLALQPMFSAELDLSANSVKTRKIER